MAYNLAYNSTPIISIAIWNTSQKEGNWYGILPKTICLSAAKYGPSHMLLQA
jgi:hypothetical protein